MADKLRIPGPEEHEDLTELNMVIVVSWAVCMLILIGLFFFFRDRRPAPEEPEPDDPIEARQAAIVDKAKLHRGDFAELDLQGKDAVAVFRLGPRDAAEAACQDLAPMLAEGTLSHEVELELLKAVDRRAAFAPWTCLTRKFLAGEVSEELEVHDEMAEFWKEVEAFDASPEIVASVLEDFRRSRKRPDNPRFYRWLRLCGLNPAYEARPGCLKILYQLSPQQGRDLLDTVETHFKAGEPDAIADDLRVIVAGLGELAKEGQPPAWPVEKQAWPVDKNAANADDDAAIRKGAMFVLCRIVNSPDEENARAAAVKLADAGSIGARETDKNLLVRWRESCGLAFHSDADDDAKSTEALAVWDGQKDSAPDYTLAWAQKRGDCPAYEDRPAWYCGVEQWQGAADEPLDLALMGFFTKTRYVEWQQEDAP